MAILGQVVQEVSSRLEQHIALRSSQCWQQITRDPAFSSPQQYGAAPKAMHPVGWNDQNALAALTLATRGDGGRVMTLADSLLEVVNRYCKDYLPPRQPSHVER